MDKRFNPDCNTFDEIVEYYKKRAIQLLRFGYTLYSITEMEWGGYAQFLDDKNHQFLSPYITPAFRGKGIYQKFVSDYKSLPIITSDDCGIEDYLKQKGYEYVSIKLSTDPMYRLISRYYGDKKAKRSNVDYMNHIDEGLAILKWIGVDPEFDREACEAYAFHPIFQMDNDLKSSVSELSFHGGCSMSTIGKMGLETVIYAMEYRSVANEYLSQREIKSIDEIRLSPLRQVNWMLIADKVQNRKDFELYHEGIHPRSEILAQYFKNWLQRLQITEEKYQMLKNKLLIQPIIVKLK